jgi:hypothetical protein
MQVSMNIQREIQLNQILTKRPDLARLGTSDAIKKILFDAMDAIVPLEAKGDAE